MTDKDEIGSKLQTMTRKLGMYFEVDSQTFNSLVRANPCKDLQTMVRIHR